MSESDLIGREGYATLEALAGYLKQGKLPTDSEVMKLAMGPGQGASFEVFETGAVVLEVVQIVFNSAFHHERMST
jgi:hypothetical protein